VSGYVFQGVACEFDKFFFNGDDVWYIKSGAFDSTSDNEVKLMLNHEGKSLASTDNRLQVHIGDDAIAFRYFIPDSWGSKGFGEVSDDYESYVPISIGFSATKTKTTTIDGVPVTIVVEATLNEISVLDKEPAVKTTYARVASLDTCGELEEDYQRIKLVGRVVSLHRAQKATENGGKVNYSHATSSYDRAANGFTRALKALI
jgi:phage head maturation protease